MTVSRRRPVTKGGGQALRHAVARLDERDVQRLRWPIQRAPDTAPPVDRWDLVGGVHVPMPIDEWKAHLLDALERAWPEAA